jgi:hypothetical protein
MSISPAEIELVLEALAIAARRSEASAARMAPGMGQHHAQRAEAMRSLCARLSNHVAELADPDVIVLDAALFAPVEIDDMRAHIRARSKTAETYEAPAGGWTWGARVHFGTPAQARPLCIEAPAAAAIARSRAP